MRTVALRRALQGCSEIHASRDGKGRDVRLGIFEAKGRYRVFMDADLATPLVHLDDVKRLMDANGEVGICASEKRFNYKGFF